MNIEELKKLNVLYVEDEEEVSSEVINNLKFFVNDIISCKNGEEGLIEFKKNINKINVIITDVLMPILSGKEMVEEIRKLNQNIPIIYTTAFNNKEFTDYIKNQKLVENISKPIDLEELFESITRLINK